MSLPEVAHRSWRLVRHPVDRVRMRTGIYGRAAGPVRDALDRWSGPEHFYFDPTLAASPVDPALLSEADAVCAGRRRVLGLGELSLPDAPWHLEPREGAQWPRIDAGRILGSAPPGFDARMTWELNRGHEWVVLARAYAATGERRYRRRLIAELESWRRYNPVGIGINWASAMEAAIRIHALAWVSGMLRGDRDPVLWRMIGSALHVHAAFVAHHRSRYSSANNHLIVELSGIAVAARVLGRPGRLANWHRDALAELASEVDRQTFRDGVNVEMATHYHMFVLEALVLTAALERASGVRCVPIERGIARMANYLAAITCADGTVLHQGDNDDGRIVPLLSPDHARQLLQIAAWFDEGGPIVAPAGEGARLVCGGVPRAPATVVGSRRFEDGGQVVLCDERLRVCLDAGPFGFGALAAHAHCDALSIAVAVDGSRFLVDRGTFRYNGDPEARDRYRMTAAHNTLQVGGREQAVPIGPFLWARRPRAAVERCELAAEADLVRATHDGFAPARHRRTLMRAGGVLIVLDEVDGAGASERLTTRWHFPPELVVRPKSIVCGGLFRAERPEGPPLGWLWVAAGPGHRAGVDRARHSDVYGAESSAATVTCEVPCSGAPWLVAVIGPGSPEEQSGAIGAAVAHAVSRSVLPEAAAETLARWRGLP